MNNKKLIRLTESDLHRIVKESVKRVLKEEYPAWGQKTAAAYGEDPAFNQIDADSIRSYWQKQGLTGIELERKVQQTMYDNTTRRNGGGGMDRMGY